MPGKRCGGRFHSGETASVIRIGGGTLLMLLKWR